MRKSLLAEPLLAALLLGACAQEEPPRPSAASAVQGSPAGAQRRDQAPGELRETRVPELARRLQELDPASSGWDTEVFNDRAGSQLGQIKRFLQGKATEADLCGIVAAGFRCGRLRAGPRRPLHRGETLTVEEWRAGAEPDWSRVGAEGLLESVHELRAAFSQAPSSYLFKIVGVEQEPELVRTSVLYRVSGPSPAGVLQQDGRWICEWEHPAGDAPPRLRSIQVEEYLETLARGGALLADCSEHVLGKNACWNEQFLVHQETWLASIPARIQADFYGHHGLALADVDGDGLEDLYVCQSGGLPNKLLRHLSDGTVADVSAAAGVDFLESTGGALFLDVENDGDPDLFLSLSGVVVGLANDGAGRFERRWFDARAQVHSLAAADYDQDGDLDLYGCVYKIPDREGVIPLPFHDSNNGNPNVLWRNEGGWKFHDATVESGLDENNRKHSFACSWEDYDNDGDLDLYVANDFGRNNLYRNEGGRFRDVAAQAGVEDVSQGMSASWADYDGDGWMDLYVGNMFSGAGNRIVYQRRFLEDEESATRSLFQRHAKGNSLFKNAGDGSFLDVSARAGVTMALWSWTSPFVELNNDGRPDIFVANGFVTSDDPKDL